jgi:hypothetical protein
MWPHKWVFLASILGMVVAWLPNFSPGSQEADRRRLCENDANSIRYVPFLIVGRDARPVRFHRQLCHQLGGAAGFQIRSQMFTRLVHLPSRFFDAHSSGILIPR